MSGYRISDLVKFEDENYSKTRRMVYNYCSMCLYIVFNSSYAWNYFPLIPTNGLLNLLFCKVLHEFTIHILSRQAGTYQISLFILKLFHPFVIIKFTTISSKATISLR